MIRFFLFCICSLLVAINAFSQKKDGHFKIDGKTKDWEQVTGAQDAIGNADPDNPEPTGDVTFVADGYDNENVYFYFRRLQATNDLYSFFYFFDINADGLLGNGEPVLSAAFDDKSVLRLAMNYFSTTQHTGYWNNSLPDCAMFPPLHGPFAEVFESSSIPELQHKEVFSAAITDDGLGVEVAVPWRFLRHWLSNDLPINPAQFFYYRVSLQQGSDSGSFDAVTASDNAGGNLVFPGLTGSVPIGSVGFFDETTSLREDILATVSATQLVAGLSYRLTVTIKNSTNRSAFVDLKDLHILNLVSNGQSIDPAQILVRYEAYLGRYLSGTAASPPIIFDLDGVYFQGPTNNGGFGEISSLTVDVTFPSPITHADIQITPKIFYNEVLPCADVLGDGGKPINPIGATLDENVQSLNNKASRPQSDQETRVMVYPIPSHGKVNVQLPTNLSAVDLELFDISGKLVLKRTGVITRSIELKDLKPGMYALQLYSRQYGKIIKKIVVTK